jgi:hypothetical protein
MEKGVAGDVVTPRGSPSGVIVTEEVKPFTPLMETVMGEVCVPTWMVAEEAERETLKSAPGGSTGPDGGVLFPPPHALKRRTHRLREIATNRIPRSINT